MDRIMLIDGNSLTYRAYYGSAYSPRGIMKTSYGFPVNAVLTLNRMLIKTFEQYKPTHILIAFDKGSKTVRHDKLDSYKGGRQKTPPELIQQFPVVKEMINKMGIKWYELDQIEADDIIGTLAKKYGVDNEVIVVSSDKDLYQLVSDNVVISVPQNGVNPNKLISLPMFYESFGYAPIQVKDFKGLVGDSSDNLPGVKGLGPKTAVKLLEEYGTLEDIYKNIGNINGSIHDKLVSSKEMAFLCKDIATLIFDVEVPYEKEDLKYNFKITNELIAFFKKYEINSLVKKYSKDLEKVENNDKDEDKQISFDNVLF